MNNGKFNKIERFVSDGLTEYIHFIKDDLLVTVSYGCGGFSNTDNFEQFLKDKGIEYRVKKIKDSIYKDTIKEYLDVKKSYDYKIILILGEYSKYKPLFHNFYEDSYKKYVRGCSGDS